MGFGRIIGYIFSVIWILVSIALLPVSLLWIWAPIAIIVVLRRQAKREVRMEEYEKRQTESLERMANRSPVIEGKATGLPNDYEHKELESKDGFWVYDKQGKPLMKLHKEDNKPSVRSLTESLDIDNGNVNGNKNNESEND